MEDTLKIKEETLDLEDLVLPSQDSEATKSKVKEEHEKSPLENNHSNKKIGEAKKPFQCQSCDKRFSQATSLKTHIASVHEGKKRCFLCEICNNQFTQKCNLDAHVISVHEGKKRKQTAIQCQICHIKCAINYWILW